MHLLGIVAPREANMNTEFPYRVESSHPIVGPFTHEREATTILMHDRALAIVVAAKSITRPSGNEIRVVHTPSGQVVYRKTTTHVQAPALSLSDD